jgi:predicted nucleic acid-binding protein
VRKYALDTNVYIRAFRSESGALELERFFSSFTPSTYLSSVVLHELLAGANTEEKVRQIEESIARPLKRTGRLFAPSPATWERAGEVLARMAREEHLEVGRVPKSFVHDLLLAVSCRESGVVLVTGNEKDFERIGRYVGFEFVAPWPGG